jgi:hypothetical protein
MEESDKGGGTWHMFYSAQHIWILTYETWESAVNSARCKHQKRWGIAGLMALGTYWNQQVGKHSSNMKSANGETSF